jgi:hypothetical protein
LAAPGLAVQSNGAIVTGGTIVTQASLTGKDAGFGLMRFNVSGTADATFGAHGTVVTTCPGFSSAAAFPLAIQTKGDIVAAGSASNGGTQPMGSFALARYFRHGETRYEFGTGVWSRPVSEATAWEISAWHTTSANEGPGNRRW